VPELKVGTSQLAAGEYSWDAGALEATLYTPPGAELDGQVFYRASLG
jgi:hypothetical protein